MPGIESRYPCIDSKHIGMDDPRLTEVNQLRESSPVGVLLREIHVGESEQNLYDTSLHETYHGVISPANVIGISVEPDEDSLGRTYLRYVDDITAAAGAVHGKGCSGDISMIKGSLSTAVNLARSRLSQYPEEVLDLVARGVMKLKSLTGDTFRALISQAYKELGIPEIREIPRHAYYMTDEKPRYIKIQSVGDKERREVYGETWELVEDGQVIGELYICSECQGEDGVHSPGCQYILEEEEIRGPSKTQGDMYVHGHDKKGAIVFDRNHN